MTTAGIVLSAVLGVLAAGAGWLAWLQSRARQAASTRLTEVEAEARADRARLDEARIELDATRSAREASAKSVLELSERLSAAHARLEAAESARQEIAAHQKQATRAAQGVLPEPRRRDHDRRARRAAQTSEGVLRRAPAGRRARRCRAGRGGPTHDLTHRGDAQPDPRAARHARRAPARDRPTGRGAPSRDRPARARAQPAGGPRALRGDPAPTGRRAGRHDGVLRFRRAAHDDRHRRQRAPPGHGRPPCPTSASSRSTRRPTPTRTSKRSTRRPTKSAGTTSHGSVGTSRIRSAGSARSSTGRSSTAVSTSS
jgi:hypothetical protein